MWLLIDDERNLKTEAVARTAEAGRKLLAAGGWECVCFDHDLGGSESGYDVLVWGLERGYIPSRVQLVTANPVGRRNMRAALEAAGYVAQNSSNFVRATLPPHHHPEPSASCQETASSGLQLLRDIRQDGYLSDTNAHRIDALLNGMPADSDAVKAAKAAGERKKF